MITADEVVTIHKAISAAAWRLDLWKFADAIGSSADHDYVKDKFRQFSELSKAINRFDADTLTKILNAVEPAQ